MEEVLGNILGQIEKAKAHGERLLLVIDGKCGSGKTTFSEMLGRRYDCNVFHVDDFYLPIVQQTQEVMKEPGGNINYDRLIDEVMIPLISDKDVMYRPFLCIGQKYAPAVPLESKKINIIEGTYSCHPRLRESYSKMNGWEIITLFMDIDDKSQAERVRKRVGEQRFKLFEDKWIPREREYFKVYKTKEYCRYSVDGKKHLTL